MENNTRPTLVLHVCCAPDEAWVVRELQARFDLVCFFCNPNIAPEAEYELRLAEASKVAAHFGVPFHSDPYDPLSWEQALAGIMETPEGGERCRSCFLLRLRRTARFCADHEYPAFTTVMSISPHKNVSMLTITGSQAAAEFRLRYEPFDFKKKDGFLKSIALSKELGLYRQDYCGCHLSKAERDARAAKKQTRIAGDK